MPDLQVYTGSSKLVVAFDIGTTFSGISYSILESGKVPEIFGVTRFPAQELVRGDAKVPSLLYYDKDGNFKAAGAEVLAEDKIQTALEEKWTKAEWWKLHLCPRHLASSITSNDDLPPLPAGKTAVDVLSDFVKYLFECARIYIKERHLAFTWASFEDSIEYIFTHPNGWEGIPQQLYRRAIEHAGLIPCTPEGRSRIHMLTEGEASLHFCVPNLLGVDRDNQADPQGVVIIDAGGGTVDLSMFSMKSDPVTCEEIAAAECRLQGSVFVTRRARPLLKKKLEGWEHSSDDEIADFTREFDQSTKLIIKSDQEPSYVRVSGRRYNNPKYDIRFGKLRLSGDEATGLFNDSVDAIISAFEQQEKRATTPITVAFLVGGLSTNDWLWSRVQPYFEAKKIKICRPDNHINKAVANGAVLSHIDQEHHLVSARVARATYGVVCALPVKEDDEEHAQRKALWEQDPTGDRYVPGFFEAKLRRGERVTEEMQFRESFSLTERSPQDFGMQTVRLACHRGAESAPTWVDQDHPSFSVFCTIHVDLSKAAKDLVKRTASGQVYYRLDYAVIVYFGFTETKAELGWRTKRGEQRIPATGISFGEDDITAVKESKQPTKALSSLSSSGDMVGEERKQPRRTYWQAIPDTSEESSTSDPGSPSAPSSPVDPRGVFFNDDKDRMIASLTAEIKQWQQSDSVKSEELEAARRNVDQLRTDIALEQRRTVESARELFEEQKKTQQLAKELGSLRNQFQMVSSSIEEKDRMIATHVTEIKQLKLGGAAQAEEPTTTRNALERSRRELITNQERHAAQSAELTARVEEWKQSDAAKAEKLSVAYRDLKQLRSDLSASVAQIADAQRRHAAESAELTSKLEELQRLNISKARDLAMAHEQITILENYRSTSSARIAELEQRNESLSMELASVKDRLRKTDSIIASLTADVDRWKRADAQKAEQLSIAHGQVQKLQKDLSALVAELADLKDRHEAQSRELVLTHEQLQESDSRANDIHNHYDRQLRELKVTVAERQPQLFEVQRFVALADEYAEWTVSQMLQNINKDVRSSISLVSNYFSRDFQPMEEPSEEQTSAVERTAKVIGQTSVDCLRRSKSRDDVVSYLAIALRAYLVRRVYWIISSWTLDPARDVIDKVLDETFKAIQQNETSTVAGRWRSLMCTYILSSDTSDPTHSLTSTTMEGLSDIVVVAGCARSASAVNETWSKFRYSISLVISAALRLRKTIMGVVSRDFEAMAVRYGQAFDATRMEVDMTGDGEGQTKKVGKAATRGRKVLCGTSLGLTKREVLPGSNEDTWTLVKAQVFLE